jgi:hypothetical protein
MKDYLIKNYSIFIKQRNKLDIDVFIVIKTINEGIRTKGDK